nr:von Willebrand factor type A domain-containing protein [uncultured Flavobacterium sp.]
MEKFKTFSLAIAMLISFLAFGQEKTITGKVTEAGLPLPGVQIIVKGTTRGTQTDIDGNYSIKAKTGEILVFSYIGMKDTQATVGAADKINIAMIAEYHSIECVVVTAVGYSKGKKIPPLAKQKLNTAPTTTNNQKDFQDLADNLVALSKQEFSVNDDALFFLNGYKIKREMVSALDLKDIKKIQVVSSEDAKKVFGNKGKNGVLLITTNNMTYEEDKKNDKLLDKITDKNGAYNSLDFDDFQESYDPFLENTFENPKLAPLSTFSIDVDNASYTNIRRFITNGDTVPKDAVRVEEMVNFFKYQYPQPKDNHPFSINTEYSECPWNANHKLLKIGLQGKNIPTNALPASNFVFLIDVSGSMSDENRLPLVKQSLRVMTEQLRKEDKVAIVVYAGAAGLVLPSTSGSEKQTILNALENLSAGGSTAGGAGIELAYKVAKENFIEGGNNRVILATDGDFNVGVSSDTEMQTLIEDKRESGVFLTCLGYGMGNYKDSKMEILSDNGNGNYAYIDNLMEANRFLGKEFKGSMFAIAKDVKIQIEFNPKHVQSYRLIGYENRKLHAEDFTNDAIDAGELGSGHTVTALYEIIPAGIKSSFFNEAPELKYTMKKEASDKYADELATIKFRYKKPDGNKSTEMVTVIENNDSDIAQASSDFKFSAAVAWFGLKLRDSKLVANKDVTAIQKLANEGIANDPDGYKAEFIRLTEDVN